MEPVGLGLGAVGVLSTLLDAVDRAKTYKSFDADVGALTAQLEATRLIYERWDEPRSADRPDERQSSADSRTKSVVDDLRDQIRKILQASDNDPLAGKGSKRRKIAWALGGKADRESQVKQLDKLVQRLLQLVPPNPIRPVNTAIEHGNGEAHASGESTDVRHDEDWQADVRHTLNEIRRTLAEGQARMRREMHGWILGQHVPNDRYDDSLNRRLPGTCDWILKHPAFAQWGATTVPGEASSDSARLLWIHGRPGFGKTILCAHIVEHLATSGNSVASFFYSADHESRHDAYVVMRSWLSQLATEPEVFDIVHHEWTNTTDQTASRASVNRLFREALLAKPGCYLVVDGLDECSAPADSNDSATSFLEDVNKAITPATHVLVVSRDETEIRRVLQTAGRDQVIEYQITAKDVEADTDAFAQSIVDRKLSKKLGDDERATVSRTMTERCEGQFLWLKMQEQTLKSWMNSRQLQNALNKTPKRLFQIYQRRWEKIQSGERSDRAVSLLRWAAFARRPLTVGEITVAALIEEEEETLSTDELPDAIDEDYISSEILEICGPLIETRSSSTATDPGSQTVHLAHFTVREFLVNCLPTGSLWQNEGLRASNERLHNTVLARSCLVYIGCYETWDNKADLHGAPTRTALREYSAGLWGAHLASGLPLDQDQITMQRVLTFMDEGHPCWDSWRIWLDIHDQDERAEVLAQGFAWTYKEKPAPPEPAYYALKLGLTGVVAQQIQGSKFIAKKNIAGRSLLHLCCARGEIALAAKILDSGADIEAKGVEDRTPLYSASVEGQTEMMRFLLGRDARVDTPDRWGLTPLDATVKRGHLEAAKLLISNGADINPVDEEDWTPLHAAARNGHVEVAKLLISSGADVNAADQLGRTPVYTAASQGHLEVTELLIASGADVNTVKEDVPQTLLYMAAQEGRLEMAKLLISGGADIHAVDDREATPLHIAAEGGHIEVVKLLTSHGADVAAADIDGRTPFSWACRGGSLNMAEFLAGHGVDVGRADNYGVTPVHAAAYWGHLPILRFLVQQGANFDVADGYGRTPIDDASRRENTEVVEFLLQQGAKLTST